MIKDIRASINKNDRIKLCKHISVQAKPDSLAGCEYTERLRIHCAACKKTHDVVIAVN